MATAEPGLSARIAALPALLADAGLYEDAFTPAFRHAVPPEAWQALLTQLAAGMGRPTGIGGVEVVSPWAAKVRVRFGRGPVGVQIRVDPVPPHRIAGLLVTGRVAEEDSVPAVVDALRALPGRAGLAVARLADAGPVPVVGLAAEAALSVGSVFKLVVLATLIRDVAAGERRWEERVAIGAQALPGGRFTGRRSEATVTVRELAGAMIAASDNSATDLLMRVLGRERIEAMLPAVGIARPEGMRPFLSTLELFKLKAAIAGGETGWLRADEAGRRRLLAGPVAAMPLDGIDAAFAAGVPLSIEAVEWRASPGDVVRVLDWVRRHTEDGPAAEARGLLAANPGVGADAASGWRYLGFKGGSEPGVIAAGFLLQRASGDWLAVAAGWNDAARAVDEGRFLALVSRLLELLRDGG